MESKVCFRLFVCLYKLEERGEPSCRAEMGKEICERQARPSTAAGGETALTHLLGSPVSVA